MVGLLTVSSGGLVAEGLSDTVVGVSEEAVVEGPSLGGAVVVGTVVGCVGAGGHRADKLRLGLLSGRERVCMTPLLAAMSASTILLPPTVVSLPSIVTGIEHLLLQYHRPHDNGCRLVLSLMVELYSAPDTIWNLTNERRMFRFSDLHRQVIVLLSMALLDGVNTVFRFFLLRKLFRLALLTSSLNDDTSGVSSSTCRIVLLEDIMTPLISWTTPFLAKQALALVTSTPLTNNRLVEDPLV